jgi:hypothetical protein
MAFQIKNQDPNTVPINEWKLKERSMKFEYEPHIWEIEMEDEIQNVTDGVEIAKLFHKHQGLTSQDQPELARATSSES